MSARSSRASSSSAVRPSAARASAKASSVGAKTVNGPSDESVSASPAVLTALTRVENCGLAYATSTTGAGAARRAAATGESVAGLARTTDHARAVKPGPGEGVIHKECDARQVHGQRGGGAHRRAVDLVAAVGAAVRLPAAPA